MSLPVSKALVPMAAALLALSACSSGSSSAPASVRSRAPLENVEEDASGRVVVAKVNAVPIYADCVQRQAEANHLSRQEALDECINFELLAQAAYQPKYLHTVEVQEKASQELVRAFVDASFQGSGAEGIPDSYVQRLWSSISPRRYNRLELRDIVFCRVHVPTGTTADSEESVIASAFLTGLYKNLKSRKDLTKTDLFTACYGDPEAPDSELRPFQKAGIAKMDLSTFHPLPRALYDRAFRARLFDGPEVAGMVTPPLFTQYGWDLILITEVLPAIATDFATAEPELRKALVEEPVYEAQRTQIFDDWYGPLEAKHTITRNFDLLPNDSSSLVPEAATDSKRPAEVAP